MAKIHKFFSLVVYHAYDVEYNKYMDQFTQFLFCMNSKNQLLLFICLHIISDVVLIVSIDGFKSISYVSLFSIKTSIATLNVRGLRNGQKR